MPDDNKDDEDNIIASNLTTIAQGYIFSIIFIPPHKSELSTSVHGPFRRLLLSYLSDSFSQCDMTFDYTRLTESSYKDYTIGVVTMLVPTTSPECQIKSAFTTR